MSDWIDNGLNSGRTYFAAFLDLRDKTGVIVGGGPVAALKAETLLRSGVRVTVVAPQLCARLSAQAGKGVLLHAAKLFEPRDLDDAAIAIAATDKRTINASVSEAARARRIPVNVADDAALSSFIMPSLVDRAPMQIAISSGGASPVLVRMLRRVIESAVPFGYGQLAALAQRFRAASKRRYPDPEARRRFWEDVFDGPLGELVLSGREDAAAQALEARLGGLIEPAATAGAIYFVAAGSGNPELLTLRALRILQSANCILYDAAVAPAVLELARRDAERVFIEGRDAQELRMLILRLVGEGKRVVRLTAGDMPRVEHTDVDTFTAREIPFVLVPCVSAARIEPQEQA